MKLSVWAAQEGIAYKTAWRMWKSGKMPVPVHQLPTGTLIVGVDGSDASVALYACVSSSDQKADLDRQLVRLMQYAMQHKLMIVDSVKEIGSGLNGHRKGLLQLLGDKRARIILVEHRDRLMRFGFEFVEATLKAQGRSIVVIDTEEIVDDVVRDLHEVIVSMCAQLYGKRSAAHRAQKAIAAIQSHDTET
jgi:predicted site-specific integrase-resolvase